MQPMRRSDNSTRDHRSELFDLIRARSFGRGKIKLASGRESDFYFDLRPTTLHPAGATHVGELIVDALEGIAVDYVGGLEMGAVPVSTATAIASHARGRDLGTFFVRKKPKEHGKQKLVEAWPRPRASRAKTSSSSKTSPPPAARPFRRPRR
jgi:orotate phosphoribosyltransferase